MKYSYWYIYTSFLVIFLDFSPIKIAGASITILFLTLPLWIFLTFKFTEKIKKTNFLIFIVASILPFINIDIDNIEEFLKTYILYLIFLIQIIVLFSFNIKKINQISGWKRCIIYLQYIIIVYSVIQFYLLKYINSGLLFNPWGVFQAFNQYEYSLYLGNIRATAFYLEPSVLGMVIIMLFWMLHIIENSISRKNLFITLIGLYVVNSLSAYSAFLAIIVYWLVNKKKNRLLTYIILFSGIIFVVLFYSYIPRIDEYSTEGSSTYWRFVAPVIILIDLIPNHLTGMPFGSYQDVVRSYGLYNGASIGSSIDNGHLLLVYYFGFTALLLYVLLIYFFVKSSDYMIKSYIVYFFIVYNFTGAIFNIEYVFLIILLPIVTIKLVRRRNVNQYSHNML